MGLSKKVVEDVKVGETHVNAYLQEVQDGFTAAHKALTEAENKLNAFLAKVSD